ncbi:basic 7S globulin-like [Chenopodium quinoa]|uniref:basic 7S globulin-like n=1 Tax=Chenopodium quinoa TaxID=63459 RepID=UPI000B795011|nr:basic 7S globulin-like [Chenopodium quinoa]
MASFICSILLTYIILTTTSASALTSFHPNKTLVLTVSKDPSTLQYTTKVIQRTPPVPVLLTLDLSTPISWVLCGNRYVSTTYRPASCGSPPCILANTKRCRTCGPTPFKSGCNKNTCRTLSLNNPFTNVSPRRGGELATDVIRINSTDGSNPGQLVTMPNNLFVCAPMSLLQGLAKGVSGVAGLGRSKTSLPTQLSSSFRLPQKFALCLPPLRENGVVFIGDGPYNFYPGVDATTLLSYTPIIANSARPNNYFIGVQGIKVGNKNVTLNKSLLSINRKGSGGTMLSVNHPYTLLQSSIYKAVTAAFDGQLRNSSFPAKRVPPVKPFQLCYDPTSLSYTRIGPVVPDIDLVLQSKKVFWRIAATNSIVRASDNAYCLGILDGGKNPRTSILVGGFQIEDNLLQFDLAKSRLGFSSSLIYDRLRCSFFNFTSNAL